MKDWLLGLVNYDPYDDWYNYGIINVKGMNIEVKYSGGKHWVFRLLHPKCNVVIEISVYKDGFYMDTLSVYRKTAQETFDGVVEWFAKYVDEQTSIEKFSDDMKEIVLNVKSNPYISDGS